MAKLKVGLDYFPLSTDFMHNRIVRRVMKSEGDSAFTVLIFILSQMYAGGGYFVRFDKAFVEDVADALFQTDEEQVNRVVRLLVEYGFFDATLFGEHGVLTSEDIQRRYLYITKRRAAKSILPEYCLITEEAGTDVATESEKMSTECEKMSTESEMMSTESNVIKQNKTKQNKNILPNPPCEGGDEEEQILTLGETSDGKPKKRVKDMTQEDIDRMEPPEDGVPRNLFGLRENLRQFRVPAGEQYALIKKSNFGAIGHPIWKGFSMLRASGGKIKLPGRYLLSLLCK